jgi:SpoVK/Ycf46/Vps4 family AAA+-type ATPase
MTYPDSPARLRESETDTIARRMALFAVEQPRRRLRDLIVGEQTMHELRALLAKIQHQHVLYEEFGLREIDPSGGRTAINLYGPPGTGKSLAAEAIAHELGMGLIRVNYAAIESKYVGETPKNIKAAFQKAHESGAVLFFDEADSMLGRRLSNIAQSTDHAVNVSRAVVLLELDQFSGVTLFATNLATNYDPAFVRRILGHIELPLPDAATRARLWQAHIPQRLPTRLSDPDWASLVEHTEGLAGGDILNAVLYAASLALAREGPRCTITRDDFMHAIAVGKQARVAVGLPVGA